MDYYKLLGIPPDADDKTIRKAWRVKTKEVHPDVNRSEDAAVQFRELSRALETLLDPVLRHKHDRSNGYSGKPKNQDSNAKQQFSEYQQKKAESIVKEWSSDYEVAMAMREEQRRKHLARHKRNIRTLWIALVIFLVLLLVIVSRFLMSNE
jgi:curved DNA-binding protein CbpA